MSKAKTRFRERLAEAQNWRCCYCACVMEQRASHMRGVTIEHYQAQSHGGPRHWSNCVAACRTCNQERGTMNPQKFFWRIQQRAMCALRVTPWEIAA